MFKFFLKLGNLILWAIAGVVVLPAGLIAYVFWEKWTSWFSDSFQ